MRFDLDNRVLRRGMSLAVQALLIVGLQACGGGSSGSAATTSSSSTAASTTSANLATTTTVSGTPVIRVSGTNFVDGSGNTVQLRGVNLSGLEFVAVQGWSPSNPWGAQTGTATPDWSLIANTWKANVVRIPLNESSWLAQDSGNCTMPAAYSSYSAGQSANADPGSNYRATVKAAVAAAAAAGMYVILDLHWTAPDNYCATVQDTFIDETNGLKFWTSVAGTFKSYPNVLFEAFNEPFLNNVGGLLSGSETWESVMSGGGAANFFITGGTPYEVSLSFAMPSWQMIVNAIRATGATNPVLIGSPSWSGDLSNWSKYAPTDVAPAGYSGTWTSQIAATWHAYPKYGAAFGTTAYTEVNNTPDGGFAGPQGVLAAGVPVLITEYGGHNATGTTGEPFVSNLLQKADTLGIGYVAWAFDAWSSTDYVLISDAAGDPTPGFGVEVKDHYICRAAGTTTCP